ncbi:MFS transporter [Sciscionella sediminilitoris]|uniref:MFS transporter n=1 Tax=Sciscionella sediminilitoris TaxID=1445613 RepID=UPI00055EED45|nr:MFS transporter [Sciscionella sp. SE31]
MPIALLALAIGAFGIGSTEFAVMGVLPDIAHNLHVSIPQAGYLVTGYAIGVVVGAPLLTALANRLSRKHMLLAMMAVFTIGNLAAAMAPNFETLMAARVLTALPHGAFFGVGSVVAAKLVHSSQRARAISMMFLGLTIANVLGVPASTALGHAAGWRMTFASIAGIGAIAVIGVALLVPRMQEHGQVRISAELRAFTKPQVWLALGIATFGFGGVFATYSYIAPMLSNLAGIGPDGLTITLALFGLGLTVGNLIGGRLADRALMPSMYIALGGLAVTLALFAITVHNQVSAMITVFFIGMIAFIAIPAVQTKIMRSAEEAPTMAAAAVQSGFNIANAAGAFLGGAVIDAGLGYTAPNLLGAVLASIGLGLAIASGLLDKRRKPVRTPAAIGSAATAEAPATPETEVTPEPQRA